MLNSIQQLHFSHTWRPYQARVLENFSKHIADNHFHIIAPPGSGKTILGIEILHKVGKKTLVLAPTLTIRNQWKDRLQDFFTEDCDFKNYSFDIKKPSDITFSTYQGLHSFYKTFDNEDDYFHFFTKNNIEVLVLDEAHHLKSAWWKCLYQLKQQHLQTIIALTATPPYDSQASEINKYFSLCGEVDDEIVVPDLVREKNLSPHQDLVFFSKPEDLEINFIFDFRLKISGFITDLLKDKEFISFLKQHRFYLRTVNNLESIYKFSDFFSAILIFLNESGNKIPKEKLAVLGFESDEVIEFPKITNEWIQVLFQYILVTDRELLVQHETYINSLEKKLRQLSIFNKNKVNLIGNEFLYKSLSNSPSKLKSITTIIKQEQRNLKDTLRCVILSDYIRKEYLNTSSLEVKNIQKLGVIPIFHHVRVFTNNKEHLAVLSGSLVIINKNIIPTLNLITSEENYSYTPLEADTEFVIITSKSSNKSTLVETITKLFELGYIKVLVGTKSLLGEGWDAPAINSLILASVVGSFVTSNQMRGRAIRIDPRNATKIGFIWHLACIDTSDSSGGKDYETLSKRFNAFLGVSNNSMNVISNGIDRLDFPQKIMEEDIGILNKRTLSISENRALISDKWKNAIHFGNGISQEVKLYHKKDKQFIKQKGIYYKDIVKYSIGQFLIGLCLFFPQFLIKNVNVLLHKGVIYFIYSLLTALSLSFGYKIYKTVQMYLRYGMIHKKINKMGHAILETLYALKYLDTPKNEIHIHTELFTKGDVTCSIQGANRYESTLFTNALNEILQPIHNPKYLLITSNWLQKKLEINNFHSVPEIFENKKERALIFLKYWNKHVKKSKLTYTRNSTGRKLLLKARLFHMHNAHNEMTRKNIIWK